MEVDGVALEEATIAQIQAAIFTGETTVEKLVQAFLNQIAACDQTGPKLNAVVTQNTEALSQARAMDRAFAKSGMPVGALHGIPMVIKDCLETTDMPTSFGSEIFADYLAETDATVGPILKVYADQQNVV